LKGEISCLALPPDELVIPREGVEREPLEAFGELVHCVIPREGVESFEATPKADEDRACDPERGS